MRRAALAWWLALIGLTIVATPAGAHPLDEYIQATYVTVSPGTATVELKLSPGVLVVPSVLTRLDPDGDQQIADTDARAYADDLLRQVTLRVDGTALPLTINDLQVPTYQLTQAGYGTLVVRALAALPAAADGSSHELTVRNANTADNPRFQINAFVSDHTAVTLGPQQRDSEQRQLEVTFTLGDSSQSPQPQGEATDSSASPASTSATGGGCSPSSMTPPPRLAPCSSRSCSPPGSARSTP